MTKPDYDLWARRPFWSLNQTTYLLLGLDPDSIVTPLLGDMQEQFSRMKDVIETSVGQGLIRWNYTLPSAKDDGHQFLPFNVITWAKYKNISCPRKLRDAVMDKNLPKLSAAIVEERISDLRREIKTLSDQIAVLKKTIQEVSAELEQLKTLGAGSTVSMTPDLVLLLRANTTFGTSYASNAPPKKLVVTDWLEKEGVSKKIAGAMDSILRPASARKGGRKKNRKP